MNVHVLREAGFEEALFGLGLNKGISSSYADWDCLPSYKQAQLIEVANKLASKDGGHNKFLESIYLWLDVTAPMYWWGQADTYRLSTKQSESVMHTFEKDVLATGDRPHSFFAEKCQAKMSDEQVRQIVEYCKNGDFEAARSALPQGWLQRRIWVMNYKCLRNIVTQRATHRLSDWRHFCSMILSEVKFPEFLTIGKR